jgi:hypothetical protein
MKKKLISLTLVLSALGGTAYFAQQVPLLPDGSCCARLCGDDNVCYKACMKDPGGPCSNNAKKPANAKKTAAVRTTK